MEIYNKIKNNQLSVELINELIDSAIYCDILNRYDSVHELLYTFCSNNDMIKEFVAIVQIYHINDHDFIIKLINELPLLDLYVFVSPWRLPRTKEILIAIIKRNNFSIGLKMTSCIHKDQYFNDIMKEILTLNLYQYEDGIISMCIHDLHFGESYEKSELMKIIAEHISVEKIEKVRCRDNAKSLMKYSMICASYNLYFFKGVEQNKKHDISFYKNNEMIVIDDKKSYRIDTFINKMIKYENYSFLLVKKDNYVVSIKEREFVNPIIPFVKFDVSKISLNKEKINYLLPYDEVIKWMLEEKKEEELLYQCLFDDGFDIYPLLKKHNMQQIIMEYISFRKLKH